jgi:hypothetical protein
MPAERAVLGAVLADPAAIAKVVGVLIGAPFYHPAHQAIYTAACALHGRGEPVEPPAILTEVLRSPDPAGRSAAELLPRLIADTGLIGDPCYYAEKVAEAAERRHLIEIGTRLRQRGYGSEPIEDLRAQVVRDLAAVLDGPAAGAAPDLVLTWAAQMAMRAPRWLDDRRIPAGAITLLAGREGIGKSTIAFDLAARLTRGELKGSRWGRGGAVAVVAGEDAWAEVIKPRLCAAQADQSRICRVEPAPVNGVTAPLSVPADLSALRRAVATHDIALLILDPIMSVMASHLDTHVDRQVREALDPLARFAAESGCATLGLIHVNKSSGSDPMNAIMGSRAFGAVARSVLFCMADPDDEEVYLYGHIKSNLGPNQPTLNYRITQHDVMLEDGSGELIPTSRVMWGGIDQRTIREALDPPRERAGERTIELAEWIGEQGRAVSSAEIAEAFAGTNRNTLNSTLSRLVKRGKLIRPGGMDGLYATPDKR